MTLDIALAIAGAGLVFGLIFDLFVWRRRRPTPTPATPSPPTEEPGPTEEPAESFRVLAEDHVVDRAEEMDVPRSATAEPTVSPTTRRLFPGLVGGLERCRNDWVMVITSVKEPGTGFVTMVSDIEEVFALLDAGRLAAVAVDIPIGLPETFPRACDMEASELVGRSSVFPAPPRTLIGTRTSDQAEHAMSQQTDAILSKIEAVDRVMTPARQDTVVEVNPEVSFTSLAGRRMAHPNDTEEGRAERLALLRTVFTDIDERVDHPLVGMQLDDILGAYVAAWSARRWVNGSYKRLGGDVDERGLRMEIIT